MKTRKYKSKTHKKYEKHKQERKINREQREKVDSMKSNQITKKDPTK